LVTECVTVYEVREKTVCYDEVKCFDTNERKLKEEKVNVKYVCPDETKIRVKKPIQKKIRVIRDTCAKFSASINGKPCTEGEKEKCDEKKNAYTKKHDKKDYDNKDYDKKDYGKIGGHQYQAAKAAAKPAAKPVEQKAAPVVAKKN